jgi:hypothetical protein
VAAVCKFRWLVRTLTVTVKMNGTEKCSRGNVIVSALTRFLKIGKQANVKRKVSDVVWCSSVIEGRDNYES